MDTRHKIKCLFLIVFLLLLIDCKRITDPISLTGIALSGGIFDLYFEDFNFRIQDNAHGSHEVLIYGINGKDSLIINYYSVTGLQENSSMPINAWRNIGISGEFHSLPAYVSINSAGGEGTITLTCVDTNRLISGGFSEDTRVDGLDSSDPNHIVVFPVKISGYFGAIRK